MSRSINPVPQYLDNSGNIVVSGEMFYFKSQTNTLIELFADTLHNIKIANPVELDAAGRLPNVDFDGSVKQVLKGTVVIAGVLTPNTQIWERDPVGAENVTGDFALFDNLIIYNLNDIVEATDGKFYISLSGANQGNDPVTPSPSKWSEIRFVGVYNASESYSIGDVVQETDGLMWRSLIDLNLGNTPVTDDGTKWMPVVNDPWILKSANFTIVPNVRYMIDASGGSVDAALPASVAVGDKIIVHNESISTNLVRLTNTALTIKGPTGTVTSSDNLELDAGDTADLAAKTTLIMEVV